MSAEDKGTALIVGPDGVERTKNEHKKYMKKIEKEQKKKEHKAKNASDKPVEEVKHEEAPDYSTQFYGEWPLCTSNCDPNIRFEKKYTKVKDLNASLLG